MPVPSGLVRISRSPGWRAGDGEDSPGMDRSRDGEAGLDFLVLDAVPADDGDAGLGHFVQPAAEDVAKNVAGKAAGGKADD